MTPGNQRFRVSCLDMSNQEHPAPIYQHIEVDAADSAAARRLADKRHGEELLRNVPKRKYNIEPMEG